MKSVLFIRGGAIGDFILTLPGIHAFRDAYPHTRVEILGYPHIAQIAYKRFYAEAVSSIDNRSVAGFFAKNGELDQKLTNYFASFDLIVSFLYDPDEVFKSNIQRCGAKRVIATDGTPSKTIPAAEHLSSWLNQLKIETKISHPQLYPLQDDFDEAERILPSKEGKPFAGIHAGSGSKTKNWSVEKFHTVAEWLIAKGFRVVFFDGPADENVLSAIRSTSLINKCHFCSSLPLTVLAGMLKRCSVFLGHDSGISHMAAALGVPTIALFGPTDPKIWAPTGPVVKIINKPGGLEAICVDEVTTEMEILLNM